MEYPYLVQNNSLDNAKIDIKDYLIANKDFVLNMIHKAGAVLFRGFNIETAENFENVLRILEPKLISYSGGDSPRDRVTPNIYTSTSYPPEETISMHHEKSYSNFYPKFIYFFCEIEPVFGGETPIADGRKIYSKMPKKILEKLSKKKLKYIMNMHSGQGLGKSWQEVFETDSEQVLEKFLNDNNIKFVWKQNKNLLKVEEIVEPIISHYITNEKIFFSQAHQWHPSALNEEIYLNLKEIIGEDNLYHNCTYGDNSKIEIEELDCMRRVIDESRIFFKWKKGDLMILDNLISMHGRSPFKGDRRILVGMS